MAKRRKYKGIYFFDDDLTILQICNLLKITGNYRNFINKKYKGKIFTLENWLEKLKEDGLDF